MDWSTWTTVAVCASMSFEENSAGMLLTLSSAADINQVRADLQLLRVCNVGWRQGASRRWSRVLNHERRDRHGDPIDSTWWARTRRRARARARLHRRGARSGDRSKPALEAGGRRRAGCGRARPLWQGP
jgi:hypothetical protein